MKPPVRQLVLLVVLLCARSSPAALVYNETVHGDLSNNGNAPTPLVLGLGVSTISGKMGADAGPPIDADVFTFTLGPTERLTSIFVNSIDTPGASFFAVAAGTSIDMSSSAAHLSNMLVQVPGEILDDLDAGEAFGGLGLTAPLTTGTYTIWFQETSSERNYSISYTVVPEPSGCLLAITGAAAIVVAPRRRKDV